MHAKELVEKLRAALMTAAVKDDTVNAHALLADVIIARGHDALPIIRRAAKGSIKRETVLVGLFLERGDNGRALSDAGIRFIIADPAHVARDTAIQSMRGDQRHSRFAPEMRLIAANPTDPSWSYAIEALGAWNDRASIDILMSQTTGVTTPFVLLMVLVKLRPPEAMIVFEMNVTHPEARTRAFALWGLAALGYEQAIAALVGLLDDADIYIETPTEKSWVPGQSMRAAQALADVMGLPFEWADETYVTAIRQHCQSLYPATEVARLTADLANGQLTKAKNV
jgi:PBS lyase HEAT-like repeat